MYEFWLFNTVFCLLYAVRCSVNLQHVSFLVRTVGTAAGRQTRRVVVVAGPATVVPIANTRTGKHIIGSAALKSSKLSPMLGQGTRPTQPSSLLQPVQKLDHSPLETFRPPNTSGKMTRVQQRLTMELKLNRENAVQLGIETYEWYCFSCVNSWWHRSTCWTLVSRTGRI